DQNAKWSVIFWKNVDTASPVRDSDGAQFADLATSQTKTLTAVTGDLVLVWAAGFTTGEGSVDSWSNCSLLQNNTFTGSADSAWATGSPTGNVQVKALTNTNIDDGALLALVIKTSAVTSKAYATLGMVGQQTLPGGADFNADGSLVAGGAIYSAVASFNGAGTLRANDRFVSGKYDETGEIASLGFTGDRLTELEF